MTTIVANLECMAADQRCTGGGPICHVQKLHRIGHSIFGIAGDAVIGVIIIEWLRGRRNPLQLYRLVPESHRTDVDILELSPEGLAYWNGWGVRMPLLDASFAIGSGALPALQALRLGKSPEEAVALVPPLDECSGVLSSVAVEKLIKPRRKRG